MSFVQGIPQAPREIRLVHGEREARKTLKTKVETWAQAHNHKTEVTLAASSRPPCLKPSDQRPDNANHPATCN